jgi:hypothetical protein
MRWIAALWLVGMPPFVVCAVTHICMAGHMQHPPFPLWQWLNDLAWAFCMASCFVLSWKTRAKRIGWLRYGSLACILLRIPLGDLGGTAFLVELPLCLWLMVVSVQYLVRTNKMEAEQPAPQVQSEGAPSD